MKLIALVLIFLAILQVAGAAWGKGRITGGEPTPLSELRSLGDVIEDAKGMPVHILYVHGMRALGPGDSEEFVKKLKRHIGDHSELATPHFERLQLEPWPQGAKVGDTEIWKNVTDWNAGQPFVHRHSLAGKRGETIIVDEVNWWPLLFPLKCRMLVQPEFRLAGVNKEHLGLCARGDAPFHPWITTQEHDKALSAKPPLGGAATANKYLKQEIVDWGFSDAVITVGPMRTYINAAIEAAFDYASKSKAAEFVVISESLGSFAVLDTYQRTKGQKSSVEYVMDRTFNLYFFANQFALLELARVTDIPVNAVHVDPARTISGAAATQMLAESVKSPSVTPMMALQQWASKRNEALRPGPDAVKQIISFSDPSDALTYRVPSWGAAKVANVYVRNAVSWLGLFASPTKAHSGQMSNRALWKAMIERRKTKNSTKRN